MINFRLPLMFCPGVVGQSERTASRRLNPLGNLFDRLVPVLVLPSWRVWQGDAEIKRHSPPGIWRVAKNGLTILNLIRHNYSALCS